MSRFLRKKREREQYQAQRLTEDLALFRPRMVLGKPDVSFAPPPGGGPVWAIPDPPAYPMGVLRRRRENRL